MTALSPAKAATAEAANAPAHTARATKSSLTVGYPASDALTTPTDLKAKDVKAIVEAINPLVADAFALYVKTKNFHWHLSGSHFRDYHLLFDEHADQIFATIDVLAERVRKIGGTTIRSISHINALQTIDDDNEEFLTPFQMLQRLIADNKAMAAAMRKAHEVADDGKDVATASVLEVFIDETERRTWFLFEVSQGGEHHTQ
ncbi:MAG: starvation/stationary phase protection protein [Chthonomonadaceae bacterium]|nr:starvation/stationary phase protection protein [Chthonomonadaceae bacterium]